MLGRCRFFLLVSRSRIESLDDSVAYGASTFSPRHTRNTRPDHLQHLGLA